MSYRTGIGVTYYEWKSGFFHCGHVAVCLSDGTYISYWQKSPCWRLHLAIGISPLKTNIIFLLFDYIISLILPFTDNKTYTQAYKQDVLIMGREADRRITFHGGFLKEDEIKEWWHENRMLSYGMLTRNCSTVAFNALRKGGATTYQHDPRYFIWTPERLYNYCEKLQWNSYRSKTESTDRIFTDFEYILEGLKRDAKISKEIREEEKKKKEKMKRKKKETSRDEKSEKTGPSEDKNSEDEDVANDWEIVPTNEDNSAEQEHNTSESKKPKKPKKSKHRKGRHK